MVDGEIVMERRKRRRLPVRVPVHCSGFGIDAATHSVNLTETGIYVETRESPPLDAPLDLSVWLPDGGEPLEISGRIVRCGRRPNEPVGVGIEFTALHPSAHERLGDFVSELRAGLPGR